MAVSNAQRATEWLATLEAADRAAGARGEVVSGDIAAGIAQTYALLALRETLVRCNETLVMSVDELSSSMQVKLEALTDAVRKI